jgi:hypothetical protein
MYEKGCLGTPEKRNRENIRFQIAKIINKMNEDPSHIVVSYTTDQEGQDIKDEDGVRSMNHRWCYQGGDETSTWKLKSRAICPTYGSCEDCMKSGPFVSD